MTQKELRKLATLVGRVIETTNILHQPLADALYKDITDATDDRILDILIEHMECMQLFEAYNRYDKQACYQDIDKLLDIIDSLKPRE
jgi:hypothetical protein